MGNWCVVHTKPGQEITAEENLQCQGFKTWLPKLVRKKQIRRRRVQNIVPMFPSSLFVNFQPGKTNFASIKYTRGISQRDRFDQELATASEKIVQDLMGQADPNGVITLPEAEIKSDDSSKANEENMLIITQDRSQ